jgi:predicted enzyme related to lactoylglutathione lyase
MGTKVIHVEVVGKDGEALQRFYKDVFGWSLDTNNPGGYGMYRQDDGLTGGIGASSMAAPATSRSTSTRMTRRRSWTRLPRVAAG